MRLFQRILCPIDFSENSVRALKWTEYLAKKFASEVVFLHVTEPLPPLADPALGFDEYESTISTRMFEFLEPLQIKYESILSSGDAYKKIVALAQGLDVSLIIIGTRGLQGTAHRLIGSTAEAVVRNSDVPVMTISPICLMPERDERRTILVPLASLDIPPNRVHIKRLLRELDYSLSLMHVISLSDPIFDMSFQANPILVTSYETTEDEKELLKMSAAISNHTNGKAVVRLGDPAEEILKEINNDNKYDYVLMGAKKKTLLYRFFKSTGYRVMSQAMIPVITIRTT